MIIGLPSPHSSAGLGDKVRENVDMECTLEIAEVKKKKKKKKKKPNSEEAIFGFVGSRFKGFRHMKEGELVQW